MVHKTIKLLTLALFGTLFFTSCYYDKEQDLYPFSASNCDTSNVTFSAAIKPILDQSCVSCHNSNSQSGGVRLDTYDQVKIVADNGRLYGSLNHENGFVAMPAGGGKLGSCTLAQIKAWINSGSPNN